MCKTARNRHSSTFVEMCLSRLLCFLYLHCERLLTPHGIMMKSLQWMSVQTHGWKSSSRHQCG